MFETSVKKAVWAISIGSLVIVGWSLAQGPPPEEDPKFHPDPERGIKDQYIVLLHREGPNGGPSVSTRAEELTRRFGGLTDRIWESALEGFVAEMSESQARAMSRSPWVKGVYQDSRIPAEEVLANERPFCKGAPVTGTCDPPGFWDFESRSFGGFPQTIACSNPDPAASGCLDNWGLDLIDDSSGTRDGTYEVPSLGTGVPVYVIDSGVMASHSEFGGRVTGGVNTTRDESDCEPGVLDFPACGTDTHDYLGHGTNVAAVIGGSLYGVAKDVNIHPLRVINNTCRGFRFDSSDFPDAFDWIVANHDPSERTGVVNLSLASALLEWGDLSKTDWDPFREGVFGLAARDNLLLIQAAGNADGDACLAGFGDESSYPTGTPEQEAFSKVMIVGGSDEANGRWLCIDPPDNQCQEGNEGSNFGRCIDIFAPAAHVVSAFRGNGAPGSSDDLAVCRLSGTSFAAPHVSGVAALILEREPFLPATQLKDRILGVSGKGSLVGAAQHSNFIGAGSPNRTIRFVKDGLFIDGFESGNLAAWSSSVP